MSTNFYGIVKGNGHKIHIGKRANGWAFMWHAYNKRELSFFPHRFRIVTVECWNQALDMIEYVEDEYGRQYSIDDFFYDVALPWNEGSIHTQGNSHTDTYLDNVYSFTYGDWC